MTGQGELLTDSLEVAETLRDNAIAAVEAAADPDERRRIDNVIEELARNGEPFSANDARGLLHGVRPALIGARFMAAAARKPPLIVHTGKRVRSTLASTHAHKIDEWIGAARV